MSNTTITLQKHKNHLETERARFLKTCSEFIESSVDEDTQYEGRPRFRYKDILKSLLILSLNGLSYRRVESDLMMAKMLGIISSIPKKSTLNKYMMNKRLISELMRLIQVSATPFIASEDTLMVDSTWFGLKMYVGGYSNKPTTNKNAPPLSKTKKLHIGCLKKSKIIVYAKATEGTQHDCPIFKEIASSVVNNGFVIDKCLADAGYLSKDNYALCQELGMKSVFIDFKKNTTGKKAGSSVYKNAFNLYKNEPEIWHEDYRYRVLVESAFSVIKKKLLNWLRTRDETAQFNEMLLRALAYNLMILGKYSALHE